MNVGLVNYDSGNLRSVRKALESCGASVTMVEGAQQFSGIEALVLPGVGAFGDAAASLQQRGLWGPIASWLGEDRPFLGICLGYQLLFESSEESPDARGFGFLQGRVTRFADAPNRKVPHMGWNSITPARPEIPVLAGINQGSYFYFVHSYYPRPVNSNLVSTWCDYGERFAAGISSGRLTATQFHPEKSQQNGLRLLQNFLHTARQ